MRVGASSNIDEVAAAARALLRFQGELGLSGLDVAEGLLDLPVQRRSAPPASAPRREQPSSAHPSTGRAGHGGGPLAAILDEMGNCARCKLASTRTTIVFGAGSPRARLMFVGEGPGLEEDLHGVPFVGAAGKLLDRMVAAMGLSRREVYIANVVKCRPPRNRTPEADEVAACAVFLRAQIGAVRPEVIVTLGRTATLHLLEESAPMTRLRGRWREYDGIPVMPTFHPAYLLRNPSEKRVVWQDLQNVMRRLGLAVKR